MKQNTGKKERLICYTCGGKGHLARFCPSADDCQHVDEIETEPSSDADSDLCCLDWGDDPITTINSDVGKELLVFFDSDAVDNVLFSVC